jgi:leader peptidase (prepilin peptidase)/N-methyltransferase
LAINIEPASRFGSHLLGDAHDADPRPPWRTFRLLPVLPFAGLGSLLPPAVSPLGPLVRGQFRHRITIVNAQLLASATGRVPLSVVFGVAAIVGLLVGSFLNVVVYRVPRGLSVSKPRSFCPTCQRQLSWWENVPIVSWIALRGRCRTCSEPISIRYPLVEGGTAATFVLIVWGRDGTWMTVPYCLLGATIISIHLIDSGDLRSPLWLAALGTAIGDSALVVVAATGRDWSVLIGAQAGTLVGIVVFGALRRLDPESRRTEGMGRSALIPAGCWLGGLGILPAMIGLGAFVAAFLICLPLSRPAGKSSHRADSDAGHSGPRGTLRILVDRPMTMAVILGSAAGLITFAQ